MPTHLQYFFSRRYSYIHLPRKKLLNPDWPNGPKSFNLSLHTSLMKKFLLLGITLFYLSLSQLCYCLDIVPQSSEVLRGIFVQGINVDLRDPVYCDGILTTEKGGVITGPNIRVQAKNIVYTRKTIEGKPIVKIEAEGDLILEFGEYVFVGKSLEYDFQEKRGLLIDGRSSIEPWYFGGERIDLLPDGSYFIHDGFITTSENYLPEWQILTEETEVSPDFVLNARNVQFRFFRLPFFWLPSFKVNLQSIFDQPVKYSFKAGTLGARVSVAYEVLSIDRFKAFARVDYNQKRGWGGGLETTFRSLDHKTYCETINYFAKDTAASNPHEKVRYRFQGIYHQEMFDDTLTVDMTWDKISDIDMPSDYKDRGLDIDYAGRTQLHVRKQEEHWISNFLARVRINNFQTIKQELPTLETNILPFELGSTGIISVNQFRLSYLDFVYGDNQKNVHDYNSSRLQFWDKLYRPFYLGSVTVTPEAGGLMIYEGNSPQNRPRWVGLGLFACELDTRIHKTFTNCKHVIHPYMRYEYYTAPTTEPNQHYIFDIDDGWFRLQLMRIGCANNFYFKGCGLLNRYLFTDLWVNAFFDSRTIPETIPKIYSKLVWNSFTTLRHTMQTAWDFEERQLDHFNFLTEWTVNENFAISTEYRHRDAFDWRKADHSNFFIDAFRDIEELRDSQMSDRRDTVLLHFFYRFHPTWSIEFESRHGWNRFCEPAYNEFEVDLRTTLRSAWNLRFSYEHKEDEDRFTFAVTLGLKRPTDYQCRSPSPEF